MTDEQEISGPIRIAFTVLIALALLPMAFAALIFAVIFVMFIVRLFVSYWFIIVPVAVIWHSILYIRKTL
jgi:hypothetical protein